MMMLRPATAASLNSADSTQSIVNSFHVLGVLAFLAASIAYWYYLSLTKQDAILALFLVATNKSFAAS